MCSPVEAARSSSPMRFGRKQQRDPSTACCRRSPATTPARHWVGSARSSIWPSRIQRSAPTSLPSCAPVSADPAKHARVVEQEAVLVDVELDRLVVVSERPPVLAEAHVAMDDGAGIERLDVDPHDGKFGAVTDMQWETAN